eukprot:PhM_4_TR10617/c0_g1_i1/m.84300
MQSQILELGLECHDYVLASMNHALTFYDFPYVPYPTPVLPYPTVTYLNNTDKIVLSRPPVGGRAPPGSPTNKGQEEHSRRPISPFSVPSPIHSPCKFPHVCEIASSGSEYSISEYGDDGDDGDVKLEGCSSAWASRSRKSAEIVEDVLNETMSKLVELSVAANNNNSHIDRTGFSGDLEGDTLMEGEDELMHNSSFSARAHIRRGSAVPAPSPPPLPMSSKRHVDPEVHARKVVPQPIVRRPAADKAGGSDESFASPTRALSSRAGGSTTPRAGSTSTKQTVVGSPRPVVTTPRRIGDTVDVSHVGVSVVSDLTFRASTNTHFGADVSVNIVMGPSPTPSGGVVPWVQWFRRTPQLLRQQTSGATPSSGDDRWEPIGDGLVRSTTVDDLGYQLRVVTCGVPEAARTMMSPDILRKLQRTVAITFVRIRPELKEKVMDALVALPPRPFFLRHPKNESMIARFKCKSFEIEHKQSTLVKTKWATDERLRAQIHDDRTLSVAVTVSCENAPRKVLISFPDAVSRAVFLVLFRLHHAMAIREIAVPMFGEDMYDMWRKKRFETGVGAALFRKLLAVARTRVTIDLDERRPGVVDAYRTLLAVLSYKTAD